MDAYHNVSHNLKGMLFLFLQHMNPTGLEQRHIEYQIRYQQYLNINKLISEEYYLRNDKHSLKLAQRFDYEVEYHQEVFSHQQAKVDKLKEKEEFLNNMRKIYNQIYDNKYH